MHCSLMRMFWSGRFSSFPSEHLIIGVAWTLVYEMYFYLIFAATLKFCRPLVSLFGTSVAILILHALNRYAPDAALSVFLGNAIAVEFSFGLIFWPICFGNGHGSIPQLGYCGFLASHFSP